MKLRSPLAVSLVLCSQLACGSDDGDPAGSAGATDNGGAGANPAPLAGAFSGGNSSTSGGDSSTSGGDFSTSGGATTSGANAGRDSSTTSGAGGTSSGTAGGAATTGNAGVANSAGSTGQAGATSGCGQSGAPTGVQESELAVGANMRTFVLSVPTAYDANTPMPLVFAWHGLGGSGSLARRYFQIESRSASGAIFVYPDGLPTGSGGDSGWDLAANGIDVAFFDALVADISAKYCIDPNRIFSAGHSFGAMITNALGCYRGDVLRAIAPVAGMPPRSGRPGSANTCTGEVAAWIAHGENDATVDFTMGGVATRDFWLGRNACSTTDSAPSTPEPCVAYSGCTDDLPVEWCVHQDGHNWPSFAGAGIWAFFSKFQ